MNNRRTIARKSIVITSMEQFFTYLLSFISRRIMLITIGVDYLGLNSTLSQILGALSVTELGIQGVIIYRLYKPVVEGNRKSICELMSVIRSFYRIVTMIIFAGAIGLVPFLRLLITDVTIPWSQVYMAWLMMALASALSYTMNYNSVILFADQKQYIYESIHLVLNISIVCINIILLYNVQSYFLYLLLNVVNTMSGNVVLLILRRNLYPWIRYTKVSKELVKDVAGSTMDMFAGRISGYVFNSTDNIVISALISTAVVGYIGNYTTITRAVAGLISSLCGPIQALIGNMLAGEGNTQLARFVKKYSYVLYVIGILLIIPTALLLDDFVILIYGGQYVQDNIIVYLLITELYITMAQASTGAMLDADGQFHIQKHFYAVSAIINIVLSVIGAITIGLAGVILGTIIGRIYLWLCRAYYCYKNVVKNTHEELVRYTLYNVKLLAVFVGSLILLRLSYTIWLTDVSIVLFIVKGTIAVAVVTAIQTLVFGKTDEFQYFLELTGISKMIRKIGLGRQ